MPAPVVSELSGSTASQDFNNYSKSCMCRGNMGLEWSYWVALNLMGNDITEVTLR